MKRRCSKYKELEAYDRLSDLPEPLLLHIISFLPTKFAVRTSFLSRRFRHLWTACPSIDLDRTTFPPGWLFVSVTNRCLRLHDRTAPLLSLSLKTPYLKKFPIKSLTKWLVSANSLGLRHLTLRCHQKTIETVLPLILSFHSLESLFIDKVDHPHSCEINPMVPPSFNLIRLKSLHVSADIRLSELTRLMTEQRNLEYLCYEADRPSIVELSSPTVKTLKHGLVQFAADLSKVDLSFPSLEFLDLSVELRDSLVFHCEMPLIRKAIIRLPSLVEGYAPIFVDVLRSVINVEELEIHIRRLHPKEYLMPGQSWRKMNEDPFHPFVDPGKELPTFPNLKRLKLSMCFHELSIEDLVSLLRNVPGLQSLEFVHVRDAEDWESKGTKCWMSKLPLNSEGSNENAYFTDLHIDRCYKNRTGPAGSTGKNRTQTKIQFGLI